MGTVTFRSSSRSMADTSQLFEELDKAIRDSADDDDVLDRVIEVADKVLQVTPQDKDAVKCKVIALIRSQKYQEATDAIDGNSASTYLSYERAYCCYRLARWDEAKKGITTLLKSNPSTANLMLAAQVAYRTGDGNSAIDLLRKAEKGASFSEEDALAHRANVLAACSLATSPGTHLSHINQALLEETQEIAFNAGCCYVALGQLANAKQILERALEVGQDAGNEEDDLRPVRLQLAVITQLEGRTEEATEYYLSVLKDKPSDATLTAVAGNNLAVARGDTDLFDSAKRLKAATSDAVFQKLPPQFAIRLLANHAILLFLMNKTEQCMEALTELSQKDPNSDIPARISAAIQFHQQKHANSQSNPNALAECVATLEKFKAQHPQSAANIDLSIAQLTILHKKYEEALRVLEGLAPATKFSPAVCASRVQLYVLLQRSEAATQVLDETIAYWESSMSDEKQAILEDLLRASADFKTRIGQHASGAKDLEKLLAIHPRDMATVARLVLAYTKFDPSAVSRFEGQLPRMSNEDAVDAYELERLPVPRKIKWDKIAGNDDVLVTSAKKKKTKKRKRMPKEYDPSETPDPYRWMPLKDRPYYTKRRRRGTKIGKGGAQGRVSEQDMAKLDQRALGEREKAVKAAKAEREAANKSRKSGKSDAKQQQNQIQADADKERDTKLLRIESKKSSAAPIKQSWSCC
eukprot:c12496_g1_i2.p1 GENE.c12496_g1_i2~~c12496_g1_i2.p1  ORF type:complete len:696 (+),score=207.29 c12496_g1_i2:1-2088(+)